MKILYMTTGFPPLDTSGAEALSLEITDRLAKQDIEVHVLVPAHFSETTKLVPKLYVHWQWIPKARLLNLPLTIPVRRALMTLFLTKAARKIIKEYKVDLLHSMSTDGHYIAGEIPTLTYLMHPCWGDYVYTHSLIQKAYILIYALRWEQKVIQNSDKLVCLSNSAKQMFASLYPFAEGKMDVIPLGVNLTRFTPYLKSDIRARYGITSEQKLILHPGGGRSERKGTLYLLKALQRLVGYDFKCMVTGQSREAGWHRRLMNEVSRSSPKNIIFTGELRYEDLPYYYSAADIVVFPSIFEGDMGAPVLEALACRKPVVCTTITDVEMLFKNHEHVIMVKPSDVESLSEALALLIKDVSLRERLAENGMTRVKNGLTIDTTINKLIKLYEDILNRSRSRVPSPHQSFF